MRRIRWIGFFLLVYCALSLAGTQASDNQNAVDLLKRMVDLEGEDELTPLITQYSQFDLPCCDQTDRAFYLFDQLQMQKWGVAISEFEDTIKLFFSFKDSDYQAIHRQHFNQALLQLERFRHEVNHIVKREHPGLLLNAEKLKKEYKGDQVRIAVFDLFNQALLSKQREHYQKATIEPLHDFGRPVRESHGNIVIDVILSIAPHVTIVPVSAEAKFYNDAMSYLLRQENIQIINISRAFPEKDHQLDQEFSRLLTLLLETKIVTKSIGNTGTDLEGVDTPLRIEKNLPPLGSLFSYDLKLIKQFLSESSPTHPFLMAINMNLLRTHVALSATIPGNNSRAIHQSLATVADGVFSWSTDNYESGSSFGAPQLAAISGLLWEALGDRYDHEKAHWITDAILKTAEPHPSLKPETIGLGCLNADAALDWINAQLLSTDEKVAPESKTMPSENEKHHRFEYQPLTKGRHHASIP